MCRFLIFKGSDPILLAHLLTRPAHSIINQSYDCRLRIDMRRPINGDGFGLGYYSCDPDAEFGNGPCIFSAVTPAWNNSNLTRLAEKTKSNLVFAHVRASTAGALSETNCHPFSYHTLMFMHNGNVAEFPKIKRRIVNHIDDKYFSIIQGSTDSEWGFSLFLDTLERLGVDPSDPKGHFGDAVLRKALLQTIEYIKNWTKEINGENGEPSLLNFAITDSDSVVVSRYITSKTEEAASLHFSSGTQFVEYEPGQYKMERHDRGQDIVMVASEPLTFERNDWVTIPTNTAVTIRGQQVLMHPIMDEYHQTDPSFKRKSDFAESKGLVGSMPLPKESIVPPLEREGRRRTVIEV
ncbi:N-terminal nucleophile aminohydrolase [Nadsonia fulvescens var. elongata DSM 6958]|uniref:N-terminal nucleophile aminohydrolase n=1 Tax=Nadsonia fulvescens var. elongata DSM 6958 TaxID=857566 RepID=A0A1E3PS55_9ASCO|nr:N-terminal nucleophile aminohydrolase [Nadsonia fulvescens var. elongata DSM 6958]